MTRFLLALPALLLAGCGAQDEPNATESIVFHGNADELIVPKAAPELNVAPVAEAAVHLAPDGLSVVLPAGAARHARFGMPRDAATRMIAAALGAPIEEGDNQECGAGTLSFASFRGGLGLYFQDGKFVGWDLDGRDAGQFATAAGIGIGSTRQQLESVGAIQVADSTLGIEFGANGLSGLLSAREPGGEITQSLGRRDVHRPLIEPATSADAEAVVALWHGCGLTRPWNDPQADFALALDGPASTILVVRDQAAILGSVMVGFDGHRGWVYYLAVSPDRRGAGLGRALMAAAEDWLRARGVPKLQLMVRDDNHAALGFYQSLGLERQQVAVFGRFLKDSA